MFPPIPDATLDELLGRVAEGRRSLSAICDDSDMPGRRTVYDRIERDPVFAQRMNAHKVIGVRAMLEDCLLIADEPATTELEVKNKRVRIDTRVRLAGKMSPKEFGDKVQLTGGDGGPIEYRNMSDEEVDARIAAIVGIGGAGETAD